MPIPNYFDRAYINISESYDYHHQPYENLDFHELIYAVAKAHPYGDVDFEVLLYDEATHELFEGRTKGYIVKKTKKYISGLSERFSIDENMANFVSLRQLKKLIKSFQNSKKRISCYSLIYIYIIYTLLKDKSSKASICRNYLEALFSCVYSYTEDNPDDELAIFFLGCYEPIYNAILDGNCTLENNHLPPVPRHKPRDDE